MTNRSFLIIPFLFFWLPAICQITWPADGNKKASVSEDIGITRVTMHYSRPGVKGREGKIWGQLVHYGFADLHYGTSKAAPWRAGANENTTLEVSTDVMIEGQPLKAGKYGFFVAMGPDSATVVLSNFSTAWGSFYYDPKDDALRVRVPVIKVPNSVEWLKYEFIGQSDSSAVLSLQWEKVLIPVTISVDLHQVQIESFRREFNSGIFYRYWQNMEMAANYCLVNNINLEEGLGWAERSINTFFGEANFKTLSTYAGLLEKTGRTKEADSVMKKALPMGTIPDLFNYGYSLARSGENRKAFDIWKLNYDKDPANDYSVLGMSMAYYVTGKNVEAVKLAKAGRDKTLQADFKSFYDSMIMKMEAGKNIFK